MLRRSEPGWFCLIYDWPRATAADDGASRRVPSAEASLVQGWLSLRQSFDDHATERNAMLIS
jgi:hypothetical protein